MSIQAVVLAAGQGKRMHSRLPKVLHSLAGKPLLEHVLDLATQIAPNVPPVVVYGHEGKKIQQALAHHDIIWIEQKEQAGTGHALLQALPSLAEAKQILVLYGDVPLVSLTTLKKLLEATPANAIGVLTASLSQPKGYGRIKRDQKNQITGIVEEKDASPADRALTEVNSGIYLVPMPLLKKWLPTLQNKNAQGEYYLTDIITLAGKENIPVHATQPENAEEILGVNDRVQLATLERFHQRQLAEKLMRQGVTIMDPDRLDIRGEVQIGKDVVLDVNVILEGRVVIGDQCVIGPNTCIRNSSIAANVEIRAHSVLDGVEIAADCVIGPFARLRPGTVLATGAHIGNFVEVKNSAVGEGTKINHLSYIGDSEIGRQVNIGAGTITCNYDGVNKHKTIIHDHVHIGSDTQLVAPVTIGAGATIGAGSTITKDVPAEELVLTHRLDQRKIPNWKRPKK